MIDISRVTRNLPPEAKGKIVRHPITGEILTKNHLPPATTKRWVVAKKAILVAAIQGELITEEEALASYFLSKEELDGWRELLKREGFKGLRVTHVREYVQKPEPKEVLKYPHRQATS